MMELKLTLPWPPSVNHFKKVGGIIKTKSGKFYQKRVNTDATKAFYYCVYQEAHFKMPTEWLKIACSETMRFRVDVDLYPPDERRRDIDNSLKVVGDSLVHAHVIHDDSQIDILHVERKNIIKHGQVIVRVSILNGFI